MADYKIQEGESLSQIAQNQGTSIEELQKANPQITDVNKIFAGQNLVLPPAPPVSPESIIEANPTNQFSLVATAPTLESIGQQIQSVQNQANELAGANYKKTDMEAIDYTNANGLKLPLAVDYSSTLDNIFAKTNSLFTENKSALEQILAAKPNYAEQREKIYEEYDVPTTLSEIKNLTGVAVGLRNQITKLETDEQTELDAIEQRQIPNSEINNEKIEISKYYSKRKIELAGQLSSNALQVQMLQGNFNLAKGLADDLVAASTADQKYNMDMYKAFVDLNSDVIDNLKDDYKTALTLAVNESEKTYKQATSERSQIVDWATTQATAPALIGVDLSKISFDDAAKRVRNYVASKPVPISADAKRINEVSDFISQRVGADSLVSWETYADAAQRFIALGGNTTDFKTSFPAEKYLDAGNQEALPKSLKPSGGATDFFSNL